MTFSEKKGSFKASLDAFQILKSAGIKTSCMFTVSNLNAKEIFDVIDLCVDLGIDYFDFDRLVPSGNGVKLKDEMISPDEYREFLQNVQKKYLSYSGKHISTNFGYKDNLWNIIIENTSGIKITGFTEDYIIKRQCLIGKSGFAILSDGTVLACRRLPVEIGKAPKETLSDIYYNSKVLNSLKNFSKVEQCNNCDISDKCYGCRAVAYAYSSGNYNSPDPQCFKQQEFIYTDKKILVESY